MICNLGVVGSIPSIGSKPEKVFRSLFLRDFDAKFNEEITKKKRENGRIPEWPNGADCKSAGLYLRWFESIFSHKKPETNGSGFYFENFAEVAQSVEHQPSKLRVAGSNLVFRSNYASVAQG